MFGALDRMSQYTKSQEIILNMYSHQVNCVKKIKLHEHENNINYDFVISSREDAFYFHALNITNLIVKFFSSIDTDNCHMVTKNCLGWGGLNMRWQMMRRRNGLAYFGGRLDYYDSMYNKTLDRNVIVQNPEMFELWQLSHLGLSQCMATIYDVPVAAARHITNGSVCLITAEFKEKCHPIKFPLRNYTCPRNVAHYLKNLK